VNRRLIGRIFWGNFMS